MTSRLGTFPNTEFLGFSRPAWERRFPTPATLLSSSLRRGGEVRGVTKRGVTGVKKPQDKRVSIAWESVACGNDNTQASGG